MADLVVTVDEAAVNLGVLTLKSRAPWLFNYASPTVKPVMTDAGTIIGWEEEWLSCQEVAFSPLPGLPRFRRLPPLAMPGVPLKMPYSVQITRLAVDFHPGNVVSLPAEVQPPLLSQTFAIELGIAFGLACIPDDLASSMARFGQEAMVRMLPPVLPVTSLQCFELRVVTVGHLRATRTKLPDGTLHDEVRLAVDRLEIVDIHPQGLENALECYVRAMLMAWVLPQLLLGLEPFALQVLKIKAVHSTLSDPPPNPAVASDALRVALDVTLM